MLYTHQWVPLSTDQQLDGSILQCQSADGAAFTISHVQAAPGLLWGQRQAWRLSKAGLVGIGVVSVLLVAAACPSQAGAHLGLTVNKKTVSYYCNTMPDVWNKAELEWSKEQNLTFH